MGGAAPQHVAKVVAAKFEVVRRRTTLPWSFHAAVASLEEDDQDELLDWAETPGEDGELPTRKQLREKVRQRKPLKEKPFDGEAAGNRLRDWLRTELDRWRVYISLRHLPPSAVEPCLQIRLAV